MRKLVIGSLLAAIGMFVWGFIFWGFKPLDPFSHMTLQQEQAVAQTLRSQLPGPGVFFLPDMGAGDEAQWKERHEQGPVAMVAFQPLGANPEAPMKMLAGFLHMLLTAVLLGLLIGRIGSASYGASFGTAALFGLAATLFPDLGQPIWFDLPWRYYLTVAVYDLVAWLIAGAVLAHFVRPETV